MWLRWHQSWPDLASRLGVQVICLGTVLNHQKPSSSCFDIARMAPICRNLLVIFGGQGLNSDNLLHEIFQQINLYSFARMPSSTIPSRPPSKIWSDTGSQFLVFIGCFGIVHEVSCYFTQGCWVGVQQRSGEPIECCSGAACLNEGGCVE